MSKKQIVTALAAALALGLFSTASLAKSYTVKELNTGTDGTFVFEPAFLHVEPGDEVTFEPTDAGHDSSAYLVPDGATPWKSELGKSITVKLDKEGVYLYECVPHHLFGMLGVIEVGKDTNQAAAEKAAADMEKQQMMNKGRLEKLMAQVK